MLASPKTKVLFIPSPNIGKIFWNEKLSKFPTNRSRILIKITGNISAVVFMVELKPRLLAIPMAITNIKII